MVQGNAENNHLVAQLDIFPVTYETHHFGENLRGASLCFSVANVSFTKVGELAG